MCFLSNPDATVSALNNNANKSQSHHNHNLIFQLDKVFFRNFYVTFRIQPVALDRHSDRHYLRGIHLLPGMSRHIGCGELLTLSLNQITDKYNAAMNHLIFMAIFFGDNLC